MAKHKRSPMGPLIDIDWERFKKDFEYYRNFVGVTMQEFSTELGVGSHSFITDAEKRKSINRAFFTAVCLKIGQDPKRYYRDNDSETLTEDTSKVVNLQDKLDEITELLKEIIRCLH